MGTKGVSRYLSFASRVPVSSAINRHTRRQQTYQVYPLKVVFFFFYIFKWMEKVKKPKKLHNT